MKKILLLALLVSLTSCSNQPQKISETQSKRVKIAIITNAIAPFWNPMIVGMERAAKEYNVDASWKGPQNGQVAEQKRLIEEAVAQGVDGISISAIVKKDTRIKENVMISISENPAAVRNNRGRIIDILNNDNELFAHEKDQFLKKLGKDFI